MTVTIHIPEEKEAAFRDAHARGDRERLRHLLGDLADHAILEDDLLECALRQVRDETPEERTLRIAAARAKVRPGQTLPRGQKLDDAVFGRWPGTETDDEVRAALDRLS